MRNDEKTERAGGLAPGSYVERVNRGIDYVLQRLDRPMKLQDVAAAAGFSPFHFHRVFQSIVGETPAQFIKRLRLEKALAMMAHDPKQSLTDVAMSCGFSASSDFSRSFKQRYGAAPSVFDIRAWRETNRDELRGLVERSDESLRVARLPAGENPDGFEIQLLDLPARTVAYIRVMDPYRSDVVPDAAQRLVHWAEEHGFAGNAWYGYMWDDPEVVALRDCRYDVAVEADGFEAKGEVGRFSFPPMRVAQLSMRGGIDLEMRALDWLYGTWLPSSGCVPDDQPCFEAWMGRPFEHGMEHFELHLHLPVKKSLSQS